MEREHQHDVDRYYQRRCNFITSSLVYRLERFHDCPKFLYSCSVRCCIRGWGELRGELTGEPNDRPIKSSLLKKDSHRLGIWVNYLNIIIIIKRMCGTKI